MQKFTKKTTFSEAVCAKYIDPSDLEEKVRALKAEAKTIATLNGSFDLMHAGHLEIIYQASLQADVLIVALNTDASIQSYKSPLRPIVPLKYRLQMMAACAMVDYVTWFERTDPIEILEKIKPHVHVNGAEYGKDCIEAQTVISSGGRIHIVELVDGLSTSYLLKKIESLCV
ncbi:MAG: adenylyltransferase/cytidyltransferase family protein [Chlamydiales bacterium]|nr:adenylyltransferase/cytidyltransferase family protein [Chlamydiales bacterium]